MKIINAYIEIMLVIMMLLIDASGQVYRKAEETTIKGAYRWNICSAMAFADDMTLYLAGHSGSGGAEGELWLAHLDRNGRMLDRIALALSSEVIRYRVATPMIKDLYYDNGSLCLLFESELYEKDGNRLATCKITPKGELISYVMLPLPIRGARLLSKHDGTYSVFGQNRDNGALELYALDKNLKLGEMPAVAFWRADDDEIASDVAQIQGGYAIIILENAQEYSGGLIRVISLDLNSSTAKLIDEINGTDGRIQQLDSTRFVVSYCVHKVLADSRDVQEMPRQEYHNRLYSATAMNVIRDEIIAHDETNYCVSTCGVTFGLVSNRLMVTTYDSEGQKCGSAIVSSGGIAKIRSQILKDGLWYVLTTEMNLNMQKGGGCTYPRLLVVKGASEDQL